MASLRVRKISSATSRTLPNSCTAQNICTPARTKRAVAVNSQHVRHSSSSTKRHSSTIRHLPAEAVVTEALAAPLAALSNKSLLRSLFVNTVSSKSWLLTPSIYFMSLLCRPGKPFILDVDRNKVLGWIMKSTVYKQFCAGETISETKDTMKLMKDMGFRGTILTYAQETVFDHRTNTSVGMGLESQTNEESKQCETIKAWREGTLKTVELLEEGDQLAVKVTGAGPKVTDAFAKGELPPQQMLDAIYEVGRRCKERKARLLIDAESQHYQWGILRLGLDLCREFNRDGHAVIYNTYQAYLKSTRDTLSKHLAAASDEGFTLGLKLVRGAYLISDPRHLIHDTKQDTDDTYNGIAQGALRQEIGEFGKSRSFPSVNLLLAGHNKQSVLEAHELHQQRLKEGLPTVPVGYAQLQGMSDEISFGLLQLKNGGSGRPEVYKCSTWGSLSECLGYLARRAVENKEAASRTVDGYMALKAEAWRRIGSIFSASPRK